MKNKKICIHVKVISKTVDDFKVSGNLDFSPDFKLRVEKKSNKITQKRIYKQERESSS